MALVEGVKSPSLHTRCSDREHTQRRYALKILSVSDRCHLRRTSRGRGVSPFGVGFSCMSCDQRSLLVGYSGYCSDSCQICTLIPQNKINFIVSTYER